MDSIGDPMKHFMRQLGYLQIVIFTVTVITETFASTLDPCENISSGMVGYGSDCTKYLLCLPGHPPTVMDCPPGTLFNPHSGRCTHHKLVDCDKHKDDLGLERSIYPEGKKASNPRARQDAKQFNLHSKPFYSYERYSGFDGPGPSYGDFGSNRLHRIRRFLDDSLQRIQRLAGLHSQNMTHEANYYRGRGGPFRMVQNLLGNSAHGVGMSKSAFTILICMRDLKQRLRLTRREMHVVMQRIRNLPDLIKFNPRRVRPDDERDAPSGDTCPFPQGKGSDCDPNSPYRTYDGSCNNLRRPLWGRAMRAFRRVIEPDYADGIAELRRDHSGHPLPSARVVSSAVFKDVDRQSSVITNMHMTFGQFLDHDIGRTAVSKLLNERDEMVDIECGESGCETYQNEACRPITLPPGDTAASVRPCLMFVRSQEVLRDDCRLGPREQLNQVSSYLDASQIYGGTIKEAASLRDDYDKADRGRMKVTQNYNRRLRPLLPQQEDKMCRDTSNRIRCFGAGDTRVNEQVGLISLHTIFHRYHNYMEDSLKKLNPHWDGDLLFHEARRIIGAIWQRIIYNEYLPPTLGPKLMQRYGLNLLNKGYFEGYNPKVNVDTLNSFQTAAFRFGHSQIPNNIWMTGHSYKHKKELFYSEVFNRPYEVYNNDNPGRAGVDSILLGQVSQPCMNSDPFFAKQITKHLFSENPPHQPGTDLPALNIQRGRDHGLPGYSRWRSWCGLPVPKDFDDLVHYMDPMVMDQLRRVYRHVEDIDLFAGAMAEHLVKGSMLGPTFACIIGRQFHNYRAGDRFWHERKDKAVRFTSYQLKEIRKMTLARIMCDTMDHVEKIQKFVMLQPLSEALHKYGATDGYLLQHLYHGDKNERRPCSALPDLDIRAWTDRNRQHHSRHRHPRPSIDKRPKQDFDFEAISNFKGFDAYHSPDYDFDFGKSNDINLF